MKVSVVSPPVRDTYFTPGRSSALGMYTVASLLKKRGDTVFTFNCPLLKPSGITIPPLEETEHLQDFFIRGEWGKLSFFTGYKHFGPSFRYCAEKILENTPDLILISSFAFAYAGDTLELVREIRKIDKRIIIGVGGSGVSSFPEYYLEGDLINFAVTGESETVIPEIMRKLEKTASDFSSLPNCYFKNSGKVIQPGERVYTVSDDLEFIWSITGKTRTKLFISTSLSRGCPKRCRFCSNFITHGHSFRKVAIEKIKEGIKAFPGDKQIILNFEDDNLTFDPEYFIRVLELFSSNFPGISFMAENGIDYSFLDPYSTRKLVQYGLRQFNLSLGTLAPGTAAAETRPLNISTFEMILDTLKELDIPVITYFICGLENDTAYSIVKTLNYLKNKPTMAGISPFYPVPGLPGFTDNNLFTQHSPYLCRGAAFYPWNNSLSTAEMVTAFRLARFINILKLKNHSALEEMLIERILTTGKLYTIVREHRKNKIIPVPLMDDRMICSFFS